MPTDPPRRGRRLGAVMAKVAEGTGRALDVERVRKDFPILERRVHEKPLVYLDSAATSQKPRQVIDALTDYYERHNANVHRSPHLLGEEATQMYEDARATVAAFLGAPDAANIVFNRGTTHTGVSTLIFICHGYRAGRV